MRSLDVQVVVSGEYLLTVHEERVPLTDVLAPDIAEGGTNQYVVYSVLDAMVGTGFAGLDQVELMLDELMVSATDVGARVRMATLQGMVSGLARMRRRAGPQPGLSSGSEWKSNGSLGSRWTRNATSTAWPARPIACWTRSTPPEAAWRT
jgi:hypothetical protein